MSETEPPVNPRARPAQLLRNRGLDPREVAFRFIIVALILVSVSLAWWSFMRVLPPLQLKSRLLASNLSVLSGEVDGLDRKWPPEQISAMTNEYAKVEKLLFSDEGSFSEWLNRLSAETKPLSLDAKADFGKTSPLVAPGVKLAIIPATIVLEVRPSYTGTPQPPYHRILQLLEQLQSDTKRADLVGLYITGGLNSITNAVVSVALWAGEERRP